MTMNVTMRQLKVFESVAKNLSFTRASEELFLTQPAVSMQIKQLEETIGLPLFEQLGKKIYLTDAGRELVHYSRTVLQTIKEAEDVFTEMKGLDHGRLDIGMVTSANCFASQALAAFRSEHPHITARIHVGNHQQVLEWLANNEVDMAVMGRPPEGSDLIWKGIMENPLVPLAAPEHPLAQEKNISLARFSEDTFLLREHGSEIRSVMDSFFKRHGIRAQSEIELGSNEAIKEAVQAGLGVTVESMHTILLELETQRLVILDVEQFPIRCYWYVVHRQGKRLTGIMEAFKKFIADEAGRFVVHRLPPNYFSVKTGQNCAPGTVAPAKQATVRPLADSQPAATPAPAAVRRPGARYAG